MTAALKVLFICPTVGCYIGGTETVVSQLSERIKGRVRLTLLCGAPGSGRPDLIAADGYERITLPFIGRDSRLNKLLSKILMSSPFKIESYSFFRSLANSALDLSEYDVIATFYEADAYLLTRRYGHLRERLRHFLPGVSMRRFFKHVPQEAVFFFGYRSAPIAKRKWGVDIASLPLGVDAAFFPPAPPPYPVLRRLIYIGRMDASKHVDWLADFFADSALAERGYRLEIVGDGPLLPALSAKYGADSGIVFHGRKNGAAVVELLRGAFLLLHPSDLESFGLTILEAMSAGVPVITHELSSVTVWAGQCPRYAGRLDRASWLAEIVRFEQAQYWEAVSAAALAHARTFTWERVAEQVMALIAPSAADPRAD